MFMRHLSGGIGHVALGSHQLSSRDAEHSETGEEGGIEENNTADFLEDDDPDTADLDPVVKLVAGSDDEEEELDDTEDTDDDESIRNSDAGVDDTSEEEWEGSDKDDVKEYDDVEEVDDGVSATAGEYDDYED